jgi:hypothetical protein
MPDIKISDLPLATAASGSMQLEVNDALSSKKVTVDQIKAYVIPDGSIAETQLATGAVTLTTKVTGILPVANGGTGSATGGGFATGTRMSFQQTSAPTGWTKDTTAAIDDSALRFVTGAVSSGGSQAFSSAFANKSVSGSVGTSGSTTATGTNGASAAYTLAIADIPSHNHPGSALNGAGSGLFAYAAAMYKAVASVTGVTSVTAPQGGGGAHSHGAASFTGNAHTHTGGTFTGTAINLAVKYYDFIIASKD